MKTFYKIISPSILFIALFLFAPQLWAQTSSTGTNEITMGIPELQLLATTSSTLNLELTTSTAGEAIQSGAQGSSYVQVSSIVPTAGYTRTINAQCNTIPAGTNLVVSATAPSNGNQGGTVGTGLADITLSTETATDIITGIGSCYTGVAADDGYMLTYTWSAALGDYASIVSVNSAVTTVTLTITAASQ